MACLCVTFRDNFFLNYAHLRFTLKNFWCAYVYLCLCLCPSESYAPVIFLSHLRATETEFIAYSYCNRICLCLCSCCSITY